MHLGYLGRHGYVLIYRVELIRFGIIQCQRFNPQIAMNLRYKFISCSNITHRITTWISSSSGWYVPGWPVCAEPCSQELREVGGGGEDSDSSHIGGCADLRDGAWELLLEGSQISPVLNNIVIIQDNHVEIMRSSSV